MADTITFTPSQQRAFDKMISFVDSTTEKVFILRGYAGTGKTTITKQLIAKLNEKERHYKLCASTGRAAKILSNLSGQPTSTIHGLLYTYKDFNQDLDNIIERKENGVENDKQIYLVFELCSAPKNEINTIYIIDESSMIGDMVEKDVTQAVFGTGKLLTDLMNFDPDGKFIFIGDNCQLPPISQTLSPALSEDYFDHNFGIKPQSAELTEIMRQTNDNDIITKSAEIRQAYNDAPDEPYKLPNNYYDWKKLPWRGCNNIRIVANKEALLEEYAERIAEHNYAKATYITNSNSKCLKISQVIRKMLGFNNLLEQNDLLLVTQNNLISGLMNGDLVKVISIDSEQEKAGLKFLKVTIQNLSNNLTYSQLLIADILYGYNSNLNKEQQNALYIDFAIRMKKKDIKQKSPFFQNAMRTDPYLNALRCVYGYALTCHKTQGGEWDEVFLEPARNIMLNPTKSNYQWLYTAMTRSKKYLYLADDFYIDYERRRKPNF